MGVWLVCCLFSLMFGLGLFACFCFVWVVVSLFFVSVWGVWGGFFCLFCMFGFGLWVFFFQ